VKYIKLAHGKIIRRFLCGGGDYHTTEMKEGCVIVCINEIGDKPN
jgi:hypothetical protein